MKMLNHWGAVQHKYRTICEFFDYLEQKGISVTFETAERGEPVFKKPTELADDFLGINRQQLERERRQLLDTLQKDDNKR